MKRFFSERLRRPVVMVLPGEYYASRTGEVLYTVVGSCIAACIFDPERHLGGINHFLLPGVVLPEEVQHSELGRYGMFAMELLIGDLLTLGAKRETLTAKLFGGANLLGFRKGDGDVAGANVRFARKYLELEGIPVLKEDLGGRAGRKILFFSGSERVLLKRYIPGPSDPFRQQEEAYRNRVFRSRIERPLVKIF